MCPDAITLLFKDAFEVFPPIKGKPTDDDLFANREVLLPLLVIIPFDAVGGVHSLHSSWIKSSMLLPTRVSCSCAPRAFHSMMQTLPTADLGCQLLSNYLVIAVVTAFCPQILVTVLTFDAVTGQISESKWKVTSK